MDKGIVSYEELQWQIEKMKEENIKLATSLKEQEVKNKVNIYSEQGKILPSQEEIIKELLLTLTKEQEAIFKVFMEQFPNVIETYEKEYSVASSFDEMLTPEEMALKYLGDQ